MKLIFIFLCAVTLFLMGCEPITIDSPQKERDMVADVLAVICPDTVQIGQNFTVQISYSNVCGGSFKKLIVTYNDTLSKVYIQPILHQVIQESCPNVFDPRTISTSLRLTRVGTQEVTVIGNYSSVKKPLEVTFTGQQRQDYAFNFRFQKRAGYVLEDYQSSLHLLTQPTGSQRIITTNIDGIWDSTFTYSNPTLEYLVNGFRFLANRNITEGGVFIIP